MTDAAITTAGPTPAAAGKKKRATGSKTKKAAADHPKYSQMIKEALTALKERGGSSRQALLKYIVKHYKLQDEKTVNSHLKLALRAGVKNNTLKQSKGTGASGSFRIGEKTTTEKKPKAKKARATAAKPKKAAKPKAAGAAKAKKPKSPKKAGAAKPKKTAKPKTAKPKTTKPKAAAKPKKPKSPKVKKPKAAAKGKKAAAKK